MQSYPNVFSKSSLFSKAVLLRRMFLFSPDAGLSQPNSQESVLQRFPSYIFPFHPVLFIEDQIFRRFSPSKFVYPLQKYPECSGHFWYEISDWYDPDIFLSGYLSGYFFIGIATGSTSDSHPLSVNARPIWMKICPTLYLSDSHPLGVNLALKGKFGGKCISHVLGFVVLRDVVKVFPVSSPSFARKITRKNRARSHSGARRGLMTKWDLKLVAWLPPVLAQS